MSQTRMFHSPRYKVQHISGYNTWGGGLVCLIIIMIEYRGHVIDVVIKLTRQVVVRMPSGGWCHVSLNKSKINKLIREYVLQVLTGRSYLPMSSRPGDQFGLYTEPQYTEPLYCTVKPLYCTVKPLYCTVKPLYTHRVTPAFSRHGRNVLYPAPLTILNIYIIYIYI